MRVFGAWILGGVLSASVASGGPTEPAELPPADYGGQQYVDSRGCMFARAGNGTKVLWIPRVSREGVPVCGNPPSGRRVPVVEEVGVQPVPESSGATAKVATDKVTEPAVDQAAGGYFVAVGSFGVQANADAAEAKLVQMNYRVVRGWVQGGSGTLITVFAGPFADAASAEAARLALRDNGFPDATLTQP